MLFAILGNPLNGTEPISVKYVLTGDLTISEIRNKDTVSFYAFLI